MRLIAQTLAELFPNARTRAPLKLHLPADPTWSRRTVARIMATIFMVGLFGLLAGLVLESLIKGGVPAPSWRRELWLVTLYGWAMPMVVFAIAQTLTGNYFRREPRTTWAKYAHARGLKSIPKSFFDRIPLKVFRDRDARDRRYAATLYGRVGEFGMQAGAMSWTTGTWDDPDHHDTYFVCVELPPAVGVLYPGTSVQRWFGGVLDVDVALPYDMDHEELRLESIALDDRTYINVAGSSQDVRWFELFDPEMVEGLAAFHDIEWQQIGPYIVFVSHCTNIDTVRVHTMDTMFAGALFVCRRFMQAAKGDLPDHLLRVA